MKYANQMEGRKAVRSAMLKLGKYRVVVRYDDPRGGLYRGPLLDTLEEAKKQLALELGRVHGTAWIEEV